MKHDEEAKQAILNNWDGLLTQVRWIDEELWGLHRYLYTCAIVGEVNMWSFEKRYCYHSETEALSAFVSWDGIGEPTGWHRALIEGEPMRRTDENGNIYLDGT